MEKKNTVLLTVIAVATLLVAVVGASFAYFAVDATNNANVEVTTKTAGGSDVFSATGSKELSMDITNDEMMFTEETKLADHIEDNTMNVSLKAGSGVASCDYYITYTATGEVYQPTVADTLEYTIQGTDGTQTFEETNLDAAEKNAERTTTFGPFTISNTYVEGGAQEATVQNWTFTNNFYNLANDQSDTTGVNQLNKTYSGNLTVTGIDCENTATAE